MSKPAPNSKESTIAGESFSDRVNDQTSYIGDVHKDVARQSESDTTQQCENGSGDQSENHGGTGFWSVAHSIGAGLLGVQSSKNRERDFTHGKPIHFVIGGVVGTLLFLLAIWLLVQYLLATS